MSMFKSLIKYLRGDYKPLNVRYEKTGEGKVVITTEGDGLVNHSTGVVFSREEVEKIDEAKKELEESEKIPS